MTLKKWIVHKRWPFPYKKRIVFKVKNENQNEIKQTAANNNIAHVYNIFYFCFKKKLEEISRI